MYTYIHSRERGRRNQEIERETRTSSNEDCYKTMGTGFSPMHWAGLPIFLVAGEMEK